MEQKNGKRQTVRRTKQQMLELLSRYDKDSSLGVKAFCAAHQISKASFYNARSRSRDERTLQPKASGFIEIVLPAFDQPVHALFAEVKGIRFYQFVTAEYLKKLIA